MSQIDEWSAWGERWRQQPAPDIARLRRQTRRKRLRMQATLSLEVLLTVGVLIQIGYFIPGMGGRWEWFGALAGLVMVVGLAYTISVRRGTWRAAGDSVSELLVLSRKRALAGIRLAWAQIVTLAIMLAGGAVIAWPYLQPDRWKHDAALRDMLLFNLWLNSPVVVIGVVGSLWYIRRQRRRLVQIDAFEQGADGTGR